MSGKLVEAGAEQVDALGAGDLGVQVELQGHLAEGDELLGGDLAAGDAGHDRVAAVLLHVGQVTVVGVLQAGVGRVEHVLVPQRGQHRRHRRAADLATPAPPPARDELVEGAYPADPDDVEELLAGEREVLAEALVDGDARLLQLVVEDRRAQRDAAAAAGAGLGGGLHLADRGEAAVVDGGADRALGHVVAVADRRLRPDGGHAEERLAALAGGEDQVARVERQVGAAGHPLVERAVVGGVADEDAAEQLVLVGRDDDLLVHAGDGVGEGQLVAAVGGAVGIAEAGDVDAEELQLGRHVGAVEGGGTAGETVSHRPGLGVARADQAVDAALHGGAFADGVDVRIGAAAGFVGQDPAPFAEVEAGCPGQFVTGSDTGREDDHVGGERLAVGEGEALDAGCSAPPHDLGRRLRGVDGDVHRFDGAAQGLAAAVVDLDGHEPGGELHDVGLKAEAEERTGRFEAEETAADDGARPAVGGVGLDGVEVLDGAVHEAAGALVARDGRHERVRAGGQHEGVVGDGAARRRRHGAPFPVDCRHRVARDELDRRMIEHVGVDQGQVFGGAAGKVGRQADPVVGGAWLFAEGDGPPRVGAAVLDEAFQQLVADHALADDDESLVWSHDSSTVRGPGFSGVPPLCPACEHDFTAGSGSCAGREHTFTRSQQGGNGAFTTDS